MHRINTTIKKRINRAYKPYSADLYHITLATIGNIEQENLPAVYNALESYLHTFDHATARTIIEELIINPHEPLDYFPGKFNNFFVLKLTGPIQEADAILVEPLKEIIQNQLSHVILRESNVQDKEFPFHPHISIGKIKNILLSEKHIRHIVKNIAKLIPRTGLAVASPTLVLYKGITNGFVPLREYALNRSNAVTTHHQKKSCPSLSMQ